MKTRSPKFQAAAALRPGSSHLERHLPCQDAVWLQQGEDPTTGHAIHAAVLCDGAGSARFSKDGAQAVSRKVGALLVQRFSYMERCGASAAKRFLLREIKQVLRKLARRNRCPMRQFASTLVAIAVDEVTSRMLTVHLGDGFLLGLHTDGRAECLSHADNGRFCNETWFTTSGDAENHLRLQWHKLEFEGLVAVYLISDGPQLCREDGSPRSGLETGLCRMAVMPPEATELYLEQLLEEEAAYSDDDLSMICLTDRNAYFRLEPSVRIPLTKGCTDLLQLLQNDRGCTTEQASRQLHTCPRRVKIWRRKLEAELLIL